MILANDAEPMLKFVSAKIPPQHLGTDCGLEDSKRTQGQVKERYVLMYAFHPIVEQVYQQVHEWIASQNQAPSYKAKNIADKLKKLDGLLVQPTFLSAAAQYYVLFPSHSFKVAFVLQNVIGKQELINWLQGTRHVVLVDVGCGAGAATVAFLNTLLQMREGGCTERIAELYCIGIDTNHYATAIYSQFLKLLTPKLKEAGVSFDHSIIPSGNLEAVTRVNSLIEARRGYWNQPHITDLVVMQVNVVSPFSGRFEYSKHQREELAALGVGPDALGSFNERFGKEETLAYRQILESAHVDTMRLITVGTKDFDSQVEELVQATKEEFSGGQHEVYEVAAPAQYHVEFCEPLGCYWRDYPKPGGSNSDFYAGVVVVRNQSLADKDWTDVSGIENLRLAWARARHSLLHESLTDEIELHLFETDLDGNLARLHQELLAYAPDLVQPRTYLSYRFPKGPDEARPRGLTRIEEEILSTALIQKLGDKLRRLAARSYAYRVPRELGEWETEYLYENWFQAYKRFIDESRDAASKYTHCAVISTDIKAFFTKIIQSQLVEIAHETLSRSDRVTWLLRLLLERNIDAHDAGRGIVQGSIGSGFYANLYLLSLDARFGAGNEWGVEFFRYVDDMNFIVPNAGSVNEVIGTIDEELAKLGLERSQDKTVVYRSSNQFLAETSADDILDSLQEQYERLTNPLYLLKSEYQELFRRAHYSGSGDEWWYYCGLYATCLGQIEIYVDKATLSRRLFRYLFRPERREQERKRAHPFFLPEFPPSEKSDSIEQWRNDFLNSNNAWCVKREDLRKILTGMLQNAWDALNQKDHRQPNLRRMHTRRLRYALGRLAEIGFGEAATILSQILGEQPWILRDHPSLMEAMARQGLENEILQVLSHYSDYATVAGEYLSAIALRSIRFLPRVSDKSWRRIVEGACSSSTPIGLLATESWLYLASVYDSHVNDEDVASIERAAQRSPPSPLRLQKNYYLILGHYSKDYLDDHRPDENRLTETAHRLARLGDATEFLTDPEPALIRHNYYSGARAGRFRDGEVGGVS